jgi:hypothetical protein
VELEQRIALVGSTWTPHQQLHPGNVAWHGTGCDGAPSPDLTLTGETWFAEARMTTGSDGKPAGAEVYAHFSPRLDRNDRQRVWDEVRAIAAEGRMTLAARSAMAQTVRESGAQELPGPFFLLQHRYLRQTSIPVLADGYEIMPADRAGDDVRVRAHRSAWAPARIKRLLGIPLTGNESTSSFDHAKYHALKSVSIYRPELDLVVLAADRSPAAFALGWLDTASASLLLEPVGTAPEHAQRGLSAAVCAALLRAAAELGATQAVVGPRGDDDYPVPKRLYQSLDFITIDRTQTFAWTITAPARTGSQSSSRRTARPARSSAGAGP